MKDDPKVFFKLYANCIPVKGAKRSVVCDLQLQKMFLIPNDLCEILNNQINKNVVSIKKKYNNKYNIIIDEYFEYLVSMKLGFFTQSPDLYPELSTKWHYPLKISNAIIDINLNKKNNLYKILLQLEDLNCKHLQIRFFSKININYIIEIMDFFKDNNSIIQDIHLVFEFSNIPMKTYERQIFKYPRLSSLSIFNSPSNKHIDVRHNLGYIIYTKQKIIDDKSCGIINQTNFIINIKNYTESLQFNSCLNRKISIDINGDIKNCPSMQQSFGNIKDTTLEEALSHEDFKKYWNITKDQIEVCKDCEFRYVCTDCRAYIENPKDKFSKPLKCGYSPYTNKWENWSTNPLKQKTIEYYNMQELVNNEDA